MNLHARVSYWSDQPEGYRLPPSYEYNDASVGSACCEECAQGGMCASQRRAAVGAMTAPSPTTLFLVAAVGILGWALLGFPTAGQLLRRVGM